MRKLLVRLGSAAVVLLLAAGAATPGDPPKATQRIPPKALQARGLLPENLSTRMPSLVEQAQMDERWSIVNRYKAYTKAEFKDPKRIKAKDVLKDVMFAKDADYKLRRAALEVLTSNNARLNDPDLVEEAKK